MSREANLINIEPLTLEQSFSLNNESDLLRAFSDVVRSEMKPYYKDVGGEEVVGFVGLGENWIQAPGELALMLYAEGSGYEFRAEDFGMDFDETCMRLEWIGTQEAFLYRKTLGRSLIARVARDMTSRFDSEYRVFETENLGVPYFAQQPRHMEATSSLVGVVEVTRALDDETRRAELPRLSSG